MCGIYACFHFRENSYLNKLNELKTYRFLQARGPDECKILQNEDYFLAFYRLALVGINNGMQPFEHDGIILLCNGEIYNYEELIKAYSLNLNSKSDCEVILHMYLKYGIEFTTRNLSGEYAYILIDTKKSLVHYARDYLGIRPLFSSIIYTDNLGSKVRFLELASMCKSLLTCNYREQVIPRYIYTYDLGKKILSKQEYDCILYKPLHSNLKLISEAFVQAVIKRITQTEKPVAFLLSGGLDSTSVLCVAMEYYQKVFNNKKLSIIASNKKENIKMTIEEVENIVKEYTSVPEVYTFAFDEKSSDLLGAKRVIDWLKNKYGKDSLNWYPVVMPLEIGIDVIPEVIYHLELYDTTTIRATVPMWLLCKYISENSKAKCIITGEVADEIAGGYLYNKYAPNKQAFITEILTRLKELYLYDVHRANVAISSNGLEGRVPFADKDFVDSILTYMNLGNEYNFDTKTNIETTAKPISKKNTKPNKTNNKANVKFNTKQVLRNAFRLLPIPEFIIDGDKEAFSDGVGYSWKDAITKYTDVIMSEEKDFEYYNTRMHNEKMIFEKKFPHSPYIEPVTNEMKFYQMIFYKLHANCYQLTTKLWLPNKSWVDTGIEPSARVINGFSNQEK